MFDANLYLLEKTLDQRRKSPCIVWQADGPG